MSTPRASATVTPRQVVFGALLLAVVLHGALLPFTVGQTYDAYIHMFFGDHYNRSWFDPWEPRWYTGFTVTAYPPGSHQLIGLLLNVFDHRTAFILVQLSAVLILTVGVFRFSRLWVSESAAAAAAVLFVLSTSLAETLHLFGQLPTTLSIGLFLNATPHIFDWIEKGRWRDVVPALVFTAGATAAHHVTPIFATLLFVAPLGLRAWLNRLQVRKADGPGGWAVARWLLDAPMRGVAMGVAMLVLIIAVVWPYWAWSISDPITQVSIPHGSRESFLERLDLGLIFFVIPWGMLFFVLPYVAAKTVRSPLWPLGLATLMAALLGTGGTTPIPEKLLGGAFWILTLDRFTFWAGLMILPFAGLAAESFRRGRAGGLVVAALGPFPGRLALVVGGGVYALAGIAVAILPLMRPTQPDFIDPAPLAQFMSEDDHGRWRYLTLGFGDQFAYHSALIDAQSVDGNYHSARRLPQLTSYSVERLENAKYLGVPGLASLNQFLTNADVFSLKFVFANDEFYDPLLYATGWNPIVRLRNGIMVWEKPDISPLPDVLARRTLPLAQRVYWGLVPIATLILAGLMLLHLGLREQLLTPREDGVNRVSVSAACRPGAVTIWTVRGGLGVFMLGVCAVLALVAVARATPLTPPERVERYYIDLDFRRFERAWSALDPTSRPEFGAFLRERRMTGGLLPSYSKLLDVETEMIADGQTETRLQVTRTYLTAIGIERETGEVDLVSRDGHWFIRSVQTQKDMVDDPVRALAVASLRDFSNARPLRPDGSVFELARPRLALGELALVERAGRFHLVGEVENVDALPACVRVGAEAVSETGVPMVRQAMGRVGAHRLLPGSQEAFRVDFEGFMHVSDAPFGGGYDPDFFSLPEFAEAPAKANVDAWATVCEAQIYRGVALERIAVERGETGVPVLNVALRNEGESVASVVRLRVSFYDAAGRLVWVEPFAVETNLIPGEGRAETYPLDIEGIRVLSRDGAASVNGKSAASRIASLRADAIPVSGPSAVAFIAIDVEAMPYDALL